MCGILGTVNFPLDKNMLDLIYHRGPDEQRLINLGNVWLGHTRLAIQDLSSAGSQPMTTEDGRYTIIFNGEIYNHYELRKSLKDINFKGHSDTETILYFLAKNGIESIKYLNGIFAFALYDKEKDKLFLARDHFGVKPLYYYHNKNRLIFSSELKPILSIIKDNLSINNLNKVLLLRYNPSPQTLFQNIKKLEPGHYIEYDIKENKITKNIFYSYKIKKRNYISESEALKTYEKLLFEAVERQLLSDVPIAFLLSGGVDSALLLKIVREITNEKIHTYTVGYNIESSSNELLEARKSAEILGTIHHEVIINEENFFKILPHLVKIIEEPLGSQSIFPLYYLSKKIHEDGFKVALSGQGADEPWCGYGRYNIEIIFNKISSPFWNIFAPFYLLVKNDKIRRGLRSIRFYKKEDRFLETYSVFSIDMIQKLLNKDFFKKNAFNELKKIISYKIKELGLNKLSGVDTMSSLDIRMNLADDLLLYTDKISMFHSLEIRVPFLDVELLEFVESLPYTLKVSLLKNKILHKKLAEKFLPKEIVYRKKKGFYTPRKEWFKGVIGEKFLSLILNDKGTFSKIFNKNYIKKIFIEHKKGLVNYEKQLFLIIILYYWLNYFVDGNEICYQK